MQLHSNFTASYFIVSGEETHLYLSLCYDVPYDEDGVTARYETC